jgi:WD40 repeat protein
LIRTFDWKGADPHGGSSVYCCKFMKPDKSTVLAVGTNNNAAKIFSVDTGEMLLDITHMDPIIKNSPVVACDTSSQGRTVIIGSASGAIHVKNIALTMAD